MAYYLIVRAVCKTVGVNITDNIFLQINYFSVRGNTSQKFPLRRNNHLGRNQPAGQKDFSFVPGITVSISCRGYEPRIFSRKIIKTPVTGNSSDNIASIIVNQPGRNHSSQYIIIIIYNQPVGQNLSDKVIVN